MCGDEGNEAIKQLTELFGAAVVIEIDGDPWHLEHLVDVEQPMELRHFE